MLSGVRRADAGRRMRRVFINSEEQQRATLTLRLIASHEPLKLSYKSNGRAASPLAAV